MNRYGRQVVTLGLLLALSLTSLSCAGEDQAPRLDGKRVVMVVGADGFRDEELEEPRSILESYGADVSVACSRPGPARGMLGGTAEPDLLLEDVDVEEFDALVFVGGAGAREYWDDPVAHALARKAIAGGKVVAAICLAPVTLARAGLLKGKRATVYPSERGRIEEAGARYVEAEVVVEGKVITASGPQAASAFGKAIAKALAEPQ